MNKLIAFGDSFTWGTDLNDDLGYGNYDRQKYIDYKKKHPTGKLDWTKLGYSKKTWPALLAQDLNYKYVCYAKPGASNHTIFRKVLSNIDKITSDDIVVVNWTWIDRWDYYDDTDGWNTVQAFDNPNIITKFYFRYIHTELYSKLETLKNIALVLDVLQEKQIKFICTCVDEIIIDKTFHIPSYVQLLQNRINNNIVWFENIGFYQWTKNKNFPISEVGKHPLEEAHLNAFKYIKNNYEITQ